MAGSRLDLKAKVGISIAFLNKGKVGYHGDGVIERNWTTTAHSCDMWFRESWGKSNIE